MTASGGFSTHQSFREPGRVVFRLTLIFGILLVSAAQGLGQVNAPVTYLSFPGRGWALQVASEGLTRQGFHFSPETDSLYWTAASTQKGMALTVHFGRAAEGLTADGIRDSLMSEMREKGYALADLEAFESGGFAYADYFAESSSTPAEYRRDTWAFAVKDGVWIHAHLSGNKYNSSKVEEWKAYLDGLKILDDYVPTSWDYLVYGTHYWTEEQFDLAAKYYGKSLELEKQGRALSDTFYVYIIDQLGMSLGIIGQHEKALEVFRFGLNERPNYPGFYYNIACSHAELGQVDSALVNLEKAYDYKSNFFHGEIFPDPFKDESFKSLWRKKEFRKLVNERHEFE
jgi:tetratricopeptide (TPR) repeat protein